MQMVREGRVRSGGSEVFSTHSSRSAFQAPGLAIFT